MTDEPKPGGRSHLLASAAVLAIVIPILYVLSMGPAALLIKKTGGLSSPYIPVIEHIYAPLGWLYDHCTSFKSFLDGYWRLIGV